MMLELSLEMWIEAIQGKTYQKYFQAVRSSRMKLQKTVMCAELYAIYGEKKLENKFDQWE